MITKNRTITQALSQKIDAAASIRKHRSGSWEVALFYLYNRLKVKLSEGGEAVLASPHDRTVWKPIVYRPVNLTLKLYQSKLARLMNVPLEFVVSPGSMALDDQIAAEFAEKVIRGVIIPKIMRIREDLLFWALLADRTLVKIRWDKNTSDVRLTVVPPTQFLIDPMAFGQDVFSPEAEAPARWVVHEKLVTDEHLMNVYGASENTLNNLPSTSTPAVNDIIRKIIEAKRIQLPDTGERYYKLYEYWEIPSQKHPKGRLITFIADSDLILQNTELPEPCLNLNRLPFVDLVEILTPDSFYGRTAIELAAPLIKSYSETASQIAQLVNETGITTAFIQATPSAVFKAETFDGETADKIVKYGGPQPPVLATKDAFSVGLLRRLDQLLMEIEMVTGVSELKYPLRDRTATEVVKSEEQDTTRHSVFVRRYIKALTDIITITLEFIKSYYPPDKKIEVIGDYNMAEIISFDKSKLDKNFNIVIANEGLAMSSKFERLAILQQVGQIAALLLQDPQMREKYSSMFARILDELLESKTQLPIEDQYNVRQARNENLQIYNTPTYEMKAETFQNHAIHIREHELFVLQKYNDPKLDTFSIQKIQTHIEEHRRLALEAQSKILNLLQGLGGSPGGQVLGGKPGEQQEKGEEILPPISEPTTGGDLAV